MQFRVVLTFCLLFVSCTASAEPVPPYSGRVLLNVTATEKLKAEVESYVGRELRSLGDVVVTNDKPDWILNILAMEQKDMREQKVGVILSIVILQPFNNQLVVSVVPERSKEWVSHWTSHLYSLSTYSVQFGPPESLRKLCNEIVVTFDSEQVNKERKIWQSLIDYPNSPRQQTPNK